MSISKRLETIADLVTPGYRASDIGTDHGYVPIYLLRNHICDHVIAADLSKGSLEKASHNITRAGLSECIECRLSDGLSEICPGEVDSIIISGMGGILMDRILRNGLEVVKAAKELILSPHRNPELIEAFAEEFGFAVVYDEVILDKKKYYHIYKITINE
ncbi:MAG: SAM-dependent methyltransferase [Lachnospiraceae bacterium]|nr:SAM-dependent methyltransferase [Lachnospiraceae bacterium]